MGDKTMTQIMEYNLARVMQETFAKMVTGSIQFQNQVSKSFLPNDKNPVSNTVLGEKKSNPLRTGMHVPLTPELAMNFFERR